MHGELEFPPALLERGNRVGVRHSRERRRDERLEARDALLVDALGEERQVIASFVQQRREDVLEERFRQVGVGREIGKRDLGLHHPELGRWRLVLLFSARNVGPNV
jgi:hypothetical protein